MKACCVNCPSSKFAQRHLEKNLGVFQGQCKSSLELKTFNNLFLKFHFFVKAVHLEIITDAKGSGEISM